MPAHPKTSDAKIVQATRELIEREGMNGFSMADVATAVGIRAPSLYNRFKDRAALIERVEIEVCVEMGEILSSSTLPDDPAATLMAQAKAYRGFVRQNPNNYSLLFDVRRVPTEAGTKARVVAIQKILPAFVALVGEQRALAAARMMVPFIHGFASMEITNGFNLGGGLDEAFEGAITTMLASMTSSPEPDE